MIDYVLEMEDVERVHGCGETAVQALRGVSLGVLPGELVAVMGPAPTSRRWPRSAPAAPRGARSRPPGAARRRRRLRARRRLRHLRGLRGADDDRVARLRRPVGQPRDHGDRGAAAGRARRGAVHAQPTAARPPRYVGGSVPSTRRRPASLTSTFQIGASALTRSISARAPANASPRCGAEAATITDGSDSAHGAGAVLDRDRAQAVALGLLGGDRLELGDAPSRRRPRSRARAPRA